MAAVNGASTTAVAPAAPLMQPGWLPNTAATIDMTAAVWIPATGERPATRLKARASGTMERDVVRPASTLVAMDAARDGSSPSVLSLGGRLGYGATAGFAHMPVCLMRGRWSWWLGCSLAQRTRPGLLTRTLRLLPVSMPASAHIAQLPLA